MEALRPISTEWSEASREPTEPGSSASTSPPCWWLPPRTSTGSLHKRSREGRAVGGSAQKVVQNVARGGGPCRQPLTWRSPALEAAPHLTQPVVVAQFEVQGGGPLAPTTQELLPSPHILLRQVQVVEL